LDSRSCSSGHGNDRDGGQNEILLEPRQLLVGSSEVVAPFRDTVGFVNGNPLELTLLVDSDESFAKAICQTEFWCYIEKTCVRMTAEEVRLNGVSRARGSRGVNRGNWYSSIL